MGQDGAEDQRKDRGIPICAENSKRGIWKAVWEGSGTDWKEPAALTDQCVPGTWPEGWQRGSSCVKRQ